VFSPHDSTLVAAGRGRVQKRRRVKYTIFHRRGAFSRGTERQNPQNDGHGRIFWRNLVFSSGAAECRASWLLFRFLAGRTGKKFSNVSFIVIVYDNFVSKLAFENVCFLRWLLRPRAGRVDMYIYIYIFVYAGRNLPVHLHTGRNSHIH